MDEEIEVVFFARNCCLCAVHQSVKGEIEVRGQRICQPATAGHLQSGVLIRQISFPSNEVSLAKQMAKEMKDDIP